MDTAKGPDPRDGTRGTDKPEKETEKEHHSVADAEFRVVCCSLRLFLPRIFHVPTDLSADAPLCAFGIHRFSPSTLA